ncbi:MAG: sugar phosphate isomerase/epimerase [Theionarchaea archaeon]|nr:sugar phosphate isomerase/epimerase [Theionarchaea archaeon]
MTGLSTLCMLDHPLETVLETVLSTFDHVEIICEGNHADVHMIESYSGTFSFHAPFSDLNTASLNRAILKESLQQITACLHLANTHGVRNVCIHPGHLSPLSIHFPERAHRVHLQSLKTLVSVAEETGVILGLENMPMVPILMGRTPGECSHFFDSIESENLKMTFDMGHANTTGNVGQFSVLRDYMTVVHLHDNEGDSDSHLAMGDGTTDFSMLPSLSHNQLVIEVNTYHRALKSLAFCNALFTTES